MQATRGSDTSVLLATICTAAKLLSTPLPTNPTLLKTTLSLHKTLTGAIERICASIINSLRTQAAIDYTSMKTSNARIANLRNGIRDAEDRLSELRGTRSGLWERVNNILARMSALSDDDSVGPIYESIYRLFCDKTPQYMSEKRVSRAEFRECASTLQTVDDEIKAAELGLEEGRAELEKVESVVEDLVGKVAKVVGTVGTWERLLQTVQGTLVDEVAVVVECGDADADEEVDGKLPNGILLAMERYQKRWARVIEFPIEGEVNEVPVDDVLLSDMKDACAQLAALF